MARFRKSWIVSLSCVGLVAGLYATHPLYLKGLGQMLVTSDPLVRADVIVVLDGDYPLDERFLYAAKLWRKGLANRIVLSATLADWQTYEDYPTWRHAMKLATVPRQVIDVAVHRADSTKEESEILLDYLSKNRAKSVIIVTSNYHTYRTKWVYQKAWSGSGVRYGVAAAPSSLFHPNDWWKHRTDSRTFFFEFTKVLWYSVME